MKTYSITLTLKTDRLDFDGVGELANEMVDEASENLLAGDFGTGHGETMCVAKVTDLDEAAEALAAARFEDREPGTVSEMEFQTALDEVRAAAGLDR